MQKNNVCQKEAVYLQVIMKIKVLPIISALFLVIVMEKILSPTNMRLVIGVSAAMFMSATVNLFRSAIQTLHCLLRACWQR